MTQPVQLRAVVLGILFVLTGPLTLAQNATLESALSYLRANEQVLSLSRADVDALVVSSQHTSTPTGASYIYFQQQIDGIPIYNAIVNVTVARDGRVVHVGNRAVTNAMTTARSAAQALTPEGAIEAAARIVGLEVKEPLQSMRSVRGTESVLRFTHGGIASDDILAELVYVPTEHSGLRLAWMVEIATLDGQHRWVLGVDAASGSLLVQDDLVDHDTWDYTVAPFGTAAAPLSLAPLAENTAAASLVSTSGSYLVVAAPFESPSHVGDPLVDQRTIVANPADPTASPLGWHNDGNVAYTITRGNNVHAYTDLDANNIPDAGSEPDGGASLTFAPTADFMADPSTYRPAAVTNLFYWNNLIHDVMYRYGFDEAAGNFQTTNVSGEGVGLDYVQAEAQDGSGTNNANFGTPRDGFRPRMQMFRWTAAAIVTVNTPAAISGVYAAGSAGFGPTLSIAGTTGDVELISDGAGLSTTDACEPLVGFTPGKIALLDRGNCAFTIKVKNAQNAGAIAAIVADNVPGPPAGMGGADATIVIPSVRVTLDSGDLFKANLPINTTLARVGEDRDSDFDNGIIVHEYGHGISNRLTGGPAATGCLPTSGSIGGVPFVSEQMGEGWSDYYALLLTDTNVDDRGIGTYVTFTPTTAQGIRPFPYSTNFGTNPTTYASVANEAAFSAPHGVGSIWATMLWDMTRDLVARHGWSPDVQAGNGGNNLALQLVTDGLKIQGCFPGFVDGRNAIMAADQINTGGANQCLVWDAFAARGLGLSADQGSFFSRTDGVEAFDLPVYCSTFAMVSDQVGALQAAGVLNKGQANSLLTKLENAEKKIDQGQPSVALNMIDAFLNEVAALVRSRKLTAEQAQVLNEYAAGLIARIQEFYPGAARSGEGIAETLGAKSGAGVPEEFALSQNFPNPFAATTEIQFALPEAARVKLVVYDVMGREVVRLVDGDLSAGYYQAALDGSRLASGTYLYRIEAGSFVAVQRMVLVK